MLGRGRLQECLVPACATLVERGKGKGIAGAVCMAFVLSGSSSLGRSPLSGAGWGLLLLA